MRRLRQLGNGILLAIYLAVVGFHIFQTFTHPNLLSIVLGVGGFGVILVVLIEKTRRVLRKRAADRLRPSPMISPRRR